MFNSSKAFGFGAGLGVISMFLVAFAVISMMQAKDDLLASLKNLQIDPDTLQAIQPPGPTTDEQITDARRTIQFASNRIRSLKITIFNHAERAAAEQSLVQARAILLDIANNAQLVADAHEQLETQFFDLVELYNRKIEEIYQAQSSAKSKQASYGLSFWAGVLGIFGAISTMILAWRKDHREVKELEIEVKKLKAQLNSV